MSKKVDKFLNPKRNNYDDVEETTRRVAPSMVQPNFGPMNVSVQMPVGFGASISTAPIKASMPMSASTSDNVYVWNLTTAPTLPEFHPLERTAVFVPHIRPSDVAGRISKVLFDRSIEAQYDNIKAKVKCVSSEGVDFRIRVYAGRNQYSHGVIVEVQRRFGSSLVFHCDTQAILDSAQGKSVPPPPILTSMNVLPEVPDDEDECDNEEALNGTFSIPSAECSLAMVAKMLDFPAFDSQYLGLQTLSSLVNPEKLSLTTARSVSTLLLRSDSEVGQKVFWYNVSRPRKEQREQQRDDESSAVALRNMSLTILANAMRASGKVPEFLRQSIRPVLLEDLQHAQHHPNTALLGDHDTIELNEALEAARYVGEARNANLLAQANKCLAAIR
jgi:hypothetical protein